MTSPVKHFHETMTGAPTLNATAGSLIALLDACLVYGFNLITLDSLAVSGGILNGTKTGHGFVADQVIQTAGAGQAVLNGEWTVTEVTNSTFKATATGVADVVGSGIITAKAAPAGWEKSYSDNNRAVYRSSDAASTRHYLRVDDTTSTYASVRGYVSMTDIDSGDGQWPTTATFSVATWQKSTDATARPWTLIADSATLYFVPNPNSSGAGGIVFSFGDAISYKPDDAFRSTLGFSDRSGLDSYSALARGSRDASNSGSYVSISSGYGQLGFPVIVRPISLCGVSPYEVSGSTGQVFLPVSPVDGGISVFPVYFCDYDQSGFRGEFPGLYHTLNNTPAPHRTVLRSPVGLPGRNLFSVAIAQSGQSARVFIDITGPWR